MLSLQHEMFSQMTPWFQRSIQLAALQMQCPLRETLENFFFASCLLCTCKTLPRANLHISCLSHMSTASKSGFGKFWHKSFSYSLEKFKLEKPCLFVVVFHEWENLKLLRDYLYFLNALLTLMIFQNKCGTAETVGMYASILLHLLFPMTTCGQMWKCDTSPNLWHLSSMFDTMLAIM